MKYRSRFKSTLASMLGVSMALQPTISLAAIHQNSYLKTDSAVLQTIDMTANTDFDFDASPPQTVGAGVALDRAYVTAAFASMAQTTFTMTEGRHRVGTVFVYRNNRFGNNVDTKVVALTKGRSNAHVAGWEKRGQMSTNYLVDSQDNVETAKGLGQTIAHENGHYVYGVYDEYREAGKPIDPADPGAPSQVDTPLNSVMHNQAEFSSFSTPGDITETTQTAHKRAHGGSAWETLSRDSSTDSAATKNDGRTTYPVFLGFLPGSTSALTRPVTGWDGAFKVVFVPNPSNVDYYVIARQLSAEQMVGVKNAVIASIRKLTVGTSTAIAVTAFPGTTIVPTIVLDTEAKREAAIAAVDAITVDTAVGDINVPLDAVIADITTFYTAGTYSPGDAVAINVFGNSQNAVATTFRDRARALRVAVNASILTFDGVQPGSSAKRAVATQDLAKSAMRAKVSGPNMSLAQLAHVTGGHFTDAHRAAALTAGAVKAQHMSHGDAEIEVATKHVNSLAANATFSVRTPVLEKTDGRIAFGAFWADEADNNHLRFELTAPDGTRFVPTNELANQSFGAGGLVRYTFDAASNAAYFDVEKAYVGRNGVWTSTVVATSTVNSPVEQAISADSSLRAEIEVIADGSANPILTVFLAASRSVQGAAASAIFYGADGSVKLTKSMTDDGKGGDRKPGDGIYSVALGGLLQAGQYDVVVEVKDGPSGAVFSTAGTNKAGVNAAPEPLGGAFARSADTLLTVAPTTVTEYYVPALKKYFITGREDEKSTLAQYPAIYTKTGMNFIAEPGAAAPTGTQPICRFYFSPPLANTHFYGTPADCALVTTTFAGNAAAKNEGVDFAVATPDATGNCPASAPVKVYRSFNNRSAQNDGNHRYTVSLARYNQMIAAGYSADGPVFCAATATDATR